jgi:hypothetical protein
MLGPLLEVLSVAMVGGEGRKAVEDDGAWGMWWRGERQTGEKRGPRSLQLARRVEQGSVRVSGCVYV